MNKTNNMDKTNVSGNYTVTHYEYHLGCNDGDHFWSIFEAPTLEQVREYRSKVALNDNYFIVKRTCTWEEVVE